MRPAQYFSSSEKQRARTNDQFALDLRPILTVLPIVQKNAFSPRPTFVLHEVGRGVFSFRNA